MVFVEFTWAIFNGGFLQVEEVFVSFCSNILNFFSKHDLRDWVNQDIS